MKKRTALLLTILLLASLTACVQEKPAENPYRLKTHTIDLYRGGEHSSQMKFDYTYDGQGYLSQIVYYLNGDIADTQTYTTDEYGNIAKTVRENADGTVFTEENKLTLDDEHRIIRSETYSDKILSAITEMEYDWQGRQTLLKIKRIAVHEGEDLTSQVESTYDSDGNVIREDTRWSDGNGGYTTHEYKKGKLIRSENYDNQDKLTAWTEYAYDKTGLVQTAQNYQTSGIPGSKTISTFDEFGNLLRSETYAGWDPVTEENDNLVDRIVTQIYEPIVPET